MLIAGWAFHFVLSEDPALETLHHHQGRVESVVVGRSSGRSSKPQVEFTLQGVSTLFYYPRGRGRYDDVRRSLRPGDVVDVHYGDPSWRDKAAPWAIRKGDAWLVRYADTVGYRSRQRIWAWFLAPFMGLCGAVLVFVGWPRRLARVNGT